jgi:hypothetical protein
MIAHPILSLRSFSRIFGGGLIEEVLDKTMISQNGDKCSQ